MTRENAAIIADCVLVIAKIESALQAVEVEYRIHPTAGKSATLETLRAQRGQAREAMIAALTRGG